MQFQPNMAIVKEELAIYEESYRCPQFQPNMSVVKEELEIYEESFK